MIEDLGSRNGTYVDGDPVTQPTELSDPALIHVAGFDIQFTHRIDIAASPQSELAHETDDQVTGEFDPADITDRRKRSRYLDDQRPPHPRAIAATRLLAGPRRWI